MCEFKNSLTMKIKHLSLVLLVACAFVACVNKYNSEEEELKEEMTFIEYTDSCFYEGYYEDWGKWSYSIYISLEIPEKICGKNANILRDSISYYALDTIGDYPKVIKDYLRSSKDNWIEVSQLRETDEVSDDIDFGLSWSEMISGEVEVLNSQLIVYRIYKEVFLGGNHPHYSVMYLNYYLPEDKVLSISDLFNYGSEWDICRLITLAAQNNEEEFYMYEAINHYSDFCIDKDNNVVFLYPPYDIAPGYLGTVCISVKAQDLEPYLTPLGEKVLNVGKQKRNNGSSNSGGWLPRPNE